MLALAHKDGPECTVDPMLLNSPIAGTASPDLERPSLSLGLASVRERELPKVCLPGLVRVRVRIG